MWRLVPPFVRWPYFVLSESPPAAASVLRVYSLAAQNYITFESDFGPERTNYWHG